MARMHDWGIGDGLKEQTATKVTLAEAAHVEPDAKK